MVIGNRQVDGERMKIGRHIVIRARRISLFIHGTLVVVPPERIRVGQQGRGIIGQVDFFADCPGYEPFAAHANKGIIQGFSRRFIHRNTSVQFSLYSDRALCHGLMDIVEQHDDGFTLVRFQSADRLRRGREMVDRHVFNRRCRHVELVAESTFERASAV